MRGAWRGGGVSIYSEFQCLWLLEHDDLYLSINCANVVEGAGEVARGAVGHVAGGRFNRGRDIARPAKRPHQQPPDHSLQQLASKTRKDRNDQFGIEPGRLSGRVYEADERSSRRLLPVENLAQLVFRSIKLVALRGS